MMAGFSNKCFCFLKNRKYHLCHGGPGTLRAPQSVTMMGFCMLNLGSKHLEPITPPGTSPPAQIKAESRGWTLKSKTTADVVLHLTLNLSTLNSTRLTARACPCLCWTASLTASNVTDWAYLLTRLHDFPRGQSGRPPTASRSQTAATAWTAWATTRSITWLAATAQQHLKLHHPQSSSMTPCTPRSPSKPLSLITTTLMRSSPTTRSPSSPKPKETLKSLGRRPNANLTMDPGG